METPETTPARSPRVVALEQLAEQTAATLARVERRLDSLDQTIAQDRADPRGEAAGFMRDLRVQGRWLIGVASVVCALTWAVVARVYGLF